jgi:hypothetical protein
MKRIETSLIGGLALVGVGVLFLLQNLGLLGPLADLIWALAFTAAGAAFLGTFASAPARWWALIPGFALLGIGALVGLQRLAPALAGAWGGALFLGMLSLGFWTVYLTGRARWWALIPGGVLLTLALIAGLAERIGGPDVGWVLFLGLGVTFGLVAIAPTPGGPIRWALIPAGVMLAMALIGMTLSGAALGFAWPAILILAGLYLAFRAVLAPRREPLTTMPSVPASPPQEVREPPARDAVIVEDSQRLLVVRPLEQVVDDEAALATADKEAL